MTRSARARLSAIFPAMPFAFSCSAGGISVRTVQRRLAEDGTSSSALVDEVRRQGALRELAEGGAPIGQIAADLGYGGHAQFVRTVQRWADMPPREVRRRQGSLAG